MGTITNNSVRYTVGLRYTSYLLLYFEQHGVGFILRLGWPEHHGRGLSNGIDSAPGRRPRHRLLTIREVGWLSARTVPTFAVVHRGASSNP